MKTDWIYAERSCTDIKVEAETEWAIIQTYCRSHNLSVTDSENGQRSDIVWRRTTNKQEFVIVVVGRTRLWQVQPMRLWVLYTAYGYYKYDQGTFLGIRHNKRSMKWNICVICALWPICSDTQNSYPIVHVT